MSDKGLMTEKNKKRMLVVGGALLFLSMLNNLVFSPAKIRANESKVIIEEINAKLVTGEILKSRSSEIKEASAQTSSQILEILDDNLPPEKNPYSWALVILSDVAEEVGINASIKHHSYDRFIPVLPHEKLDKNSVPMWMTYAVDVEMETGFYDLIQYLSILHASQPYCSLASFEIMTLRSSPEKHRINMTFEWPVLRFSEERAQLETLSEMDSGS